MLKEELNDELRLVMRENKDLSIGVAAMEVVIRYIKQSEASTLVELLREMSDVGRVLGKCNPGAVSVSSACELFCRFITLIPLDMPIFEETRQKLLDRGMLFKTMAVESREKVAEKGYDFMRSGAVVLIHSMSRVVLRLFSKLASLGGRHFTIYITESQPDCSGYVMRDRLQEMGFPAEVILDSAIGFVMPTVDLVVVGAEGVVGNGGIVNKIGTYSIAVMAKFKHKPFYCLAESFKFVRMYPLTQSELPFDKEQAASNRFSHLPDGGGTPEAAAAAALSQRWDPSTHPLIDYTPPELITLLFTDIGVLTPSAVGDELMKLYL